MEQRNAGAALLGHELALGARRDIIAHGLRVPADLARVGFDDIEDGRYDVPPLATASPVKPQIADGAPRCLAIVSTGDWTTSRPAKSLSRTG